MMLALCAKCVKKFANQMLASLHTSAAHIQDQTKPLPAKPLPMLIKEGLVRHVGRFARMSVDSKYTVVCTADKLFLFRMRRRLHITLTRKNEDKETTASRPSSSKSMEHYHVWKYVCMCQPFSRLYYAKTI